MSEQVSKEPTLECEVCGKNGFPGDVCHGKALHLDRQFTLSEIRSGRVPDDNEAYHRDSAAAPKIVNLPGSEPPAKA